MPEMFYQGKLLIGAGDAGTGVGTSSTWTDASKSGTWTADQWKTNYVLIDSTGKAFVITANTALGVLTVSGTPTSGWYTITPLSTYTSAQVIQCNSVDATFTNNLESYWSIANDAGRGIRFAIEKQREISLKLDLNFCNAYQLSRFYDSTITGTTPTPTTTYTPFMVVIDYTTAVTLGDATKCMRVVFDGVVFDENSIPVNPKDMVKESVTAYAKNCTAYYITSEAQHA